MFATTVGRDSVGTGGYALQIWSRARAHRGSAAKTCTLPPARVERPTDRATISECQIDGPAKAAIVSRIIHRDTTSWHHRTALAVAESPASDLGLGWPPKRPRPQP